MSLRMLRVLPRLVLHHLVSLQFSGCFWTMQVIRSHPAGRQPDGDLCGGHVANSVADMGLLTWCLEWTVKGYVRGNRLKRVILQPYINTCVTITCAYIFRRSRTRHHPDQTKRGYIRKSAVSVQRSDQNQQNVLGDEEKSIPSGKSGRQTAFWWLSWFDGYS